MFYKAEGSRIKIGNTDMDYVVSGCGKQPLVVIPGLSDGLKTVKGQALTLAAYYKKFSKDFRIYTFSRKNSLEKGYSTRDMARDQKTAMEILGIKKACVMGISQGGMISQYLAIDYPEIVEKLVIAVSVSRPNPTLDEVVNSWINMAETKDYKKLIIDTMYKTYTKKHYNKYKPLLPIFSRIGKPESFERFIIQAKACLSHNAYNELNMIKSPVLVIGGDSDRVVGKNTSEEMAERIEQSKLVLYKELGHGSYEEAKDFYPKVKDFLL